MDVGRTSTLRRRRSGSLIISYLLLAADQTAVTCIAHTLRLCMLCPISDTHPANKQRPAHFLPSICRDGGVGVLLQEPRGHTALRAPMTQPCTPWEGSRNSALFTAFSSYYCLIFQPGKVQQCASASITQDTRQTLGRQGAHQAARNLTNAS